MNKVYKVSVMLLLLAVMSGCATSTKVVELQPATGAIVRDRVDFSRARHSSSSDKGDSESRTYSTQLWVFPAVVVDIQEQVAINPAHTINVSDLLAWETQHGRIPVGSVVLLRTGWKKEWERPDLYPGGKFQFPTCDGTVTPFLLQERQIAGVGIDRQHDFAPEEGDQAKILLAQWVDEGQGLVLENLQKLDQLPLTGVNLQIGILYKEDIKERAVVSVKAFIPQG